MSTKRGSKIAFFALATSVLVAGLGTYVWSAENRPKALEIYIFNLKNGRSMFIRTPNDKRILIDGGSNSDIVRELTKVLPFYSRHIDIIIATNSAGKNTSGLIDVLKRYEDKKIFVSAFTVESLGLASSADKIYETFLQTAGNVENIEAGRTLDLDHEVNLKILFPVSPSEFEYSKASAPELLFSVSYKSTAVTFLGEATTKVQKYLADKASSANVLIFSNGTMPADIAPALLERSKPKFFIHSKAITAKTPKKKSIPKNQKPVPKSIKEKVMEILNVKEGTIKLETDGETLRTSLG